MIISNIFRVHEKTQVSDGIGGFKDVWEDNGWVDGYLDLASGTDKNAIQNAMTEQSSHILTTDGMPALKIDANMRIEDKNKRIYTINYVDNVMDQDDHLEIYLDFGGE